MCPHIQHLGSARHHRRGVDKDGTPLNEQLDKKWQGLLNLIAMVLGKLNAQDEPSHCRMCEALSRLRRAPS